MRSPDMETCSLCGDEVPFSSLREVIGVAVIYEGALICRACRHENPATRTRRV